MTTFKMKPSELEETLLNIEAYLIDADETTKFKVMFISEELLTNLVRHADFEDRTPYITFNIRANKNNNFNIECIDNAKSFDFLAHKNPDVNAKLEDREIGGLGIFLTKQYAKELEYIYEDGFNILRISL